MRHFASRLPLSDGPTVPSESQAQQLSVRAPPVPPQAPAPAVAREPTPEPPEPTLDPSAIYMTSLDYLAAHGIEIPTWDDDGGL